MKQIIHWIKTHTGLLKTLFVIAVSIIVVAQLLSIGKTISFEQLKQIFDEIPLWKLLLMMVIGLVSVTPMLNYDLTLNRILNLKVSKRELLESSWIVNTINNIGGFGGLVSMGLRSEFYGNKTEEKKILPALTHILLFVLSGLSIYSILCFFLVQFDPKMAYLQQYWIWLLGGGLYFPLLYLILHFQKNSSFGNLDAKNRLSLVVSSFLEWTGVLITFISIGYLLDVPIPLIDIVPLYVAASIIGIASMIPGALGSFDVMMILGLSNLGVDREIIVLWLLLYRLFYYIIPFLIGCLFFTKHLSQKLDTHYRQLLKQITLEIAHKLEVVLLYFSGIMMVLLATIPEAFTQVHWLRDINPFRSHIIIQIPSIVLGFALLIMGRGIADRVKRAYYPTIILLIGAILYSFVVDFSMFSIFYLAILLFIVIFSKSELYREQLVYSWEWMTIDGFIFGLLTLLYLVIGVYNLPNFPHHRHHFVEFFLFPSERIWLSGFIAILLVMSFNFLFVRYLQGKKHQVGEFPEDSILHNILTTYGGNIDSELVFLHDKQVFLYPKEEPTVFLQFNTINNKCVVMGNPSGNKEDFPAAIDAFLKETDRFGYVPVFYETDEDSVMLLHEYGYEFIKMGEEALVNLETFTMSGKKFKGTRAVFNKITKAGYSFDVLQPPFSAEQMHELKAISDSWLDNRKEKGFSLGFFDEAYLQRNPIAVVRNAEGEMVSFANIIPSYTNEVGTIDLMRHHKEKAPSGSMDFLFIHLFEYMKTENIHYFNLGMAPLANVGQSRKSFIQERIAALIYEFGSEIYSFQGLREYKEKFASKWQPRYTLYSKSSWIVYVMIALLIVDQKNID